MSRKRPPKSKLALISGHIAEARRIIDTQHASYASSLMHLLAHEEKLKLEAVAMKGETKLKGGHSKG
jgi:hypothetical protein